MTYSPTFEQKKLIQAHQSHKVKEQSEKGEMGKMIFISLFWSLVVLMFQ